MGRFVWMICLLLAAPAAAEKPNPAFAGRTGFGDFPELPTAMTSTGRLQPLRRWDDLVRATEQSVNTVYAQLNNDVGPERTAEAAHSTVTDDSSMVSISMLPR